jgi:hypothetical protein
MEAEFSVNGSGKRIYPVPIGNDEFPEGFLWKFTGYCVRSHRPAYVILLMVVAEISMEIAATCSSSPSRPGSGSLFLFTAAARQLQLIFFAVAAR